MRAGTRQHGIGVTVAAWAAGLRFPILWMLLTNFESASLERSNGRSNEEHSNLV